jgi:hypothetical protein
MTDDDALIADLHLLGDSHSARSNSRRIAIQAAARIAALTAERDKLQELAGDGIHAERAALIRATKAEAALRQAVPSEPTQAMWQAARDAIPDCHMNIDEIWRAMYDAALAAQEKP